MSKDNGKTPKPDPKTATKSAIKPGRNGNCLPAVGAHPWNTGGKPGRSGRKPDKWRDDCRKALKDARALPVVQRIISGDIQEEIGQTKDGDPIYGETKNADRLGAVKFLAGYAHGQPTERTEFEGELTIRVAYDD